MVQAQEFRREDAPGAAVSAWLRLRYPREEVSEKVRFDMIRFDRAGVNERTDLLVSALTVMGKLTVTSNPSGASVRVAGILWDETTDTSRFVDEGEHTIDVAKDGHPTHHGKVTVKKRKETTYNATLN